MECPQCQRKTPFDAEFCPECGIKLAVVCASCGAENGAGHKFCKRCGRPLRAAAAQALPGPAFVSPQSYTPKHLAERILGVRSALEGERKHVTVLFCDIVESSRLAEQMDPEAMHQLMDRVLRLMADGVHRYHGTVNQFLGDGLMALFGAPVALEDHPLSAVLAALAIRETLGGFGEELKRERGVDLRVRLGLNSGLVVVGRIGDDLRMDYTAVGDTTHLAARMQSLAEPGAILITEATHQLVEGYIRSEPVGPVQVRGRSEPVQVYKVTGRRRRRGRLEVRAEQGLTPLVGRHREPPLLRDCLARANAGRGQVVGIVGEAGVGKSRLLHEFRKSLERGQVTWLEGHCAAYHESAPYLPVNEILRAYFGIEEGDNPLQIQEKMRQGGRRLGPGHEGILPYLRESIGLPSESDVLRELDTAMKRRKTFEAVRALLFAGSQRRPLVLVVEDLHWLDKTSEECLDFLVESLFGMRVLLLTTFRPGYAVKWATKTYYTQIALGRLSGVEVEQMLRSLLGADASLDPLKELLVGRTEGNPLFLEETVRMLVQSLALAGERGAYRLVKPLQLIQVPVTVQAVLAARIDRLPPEEKDLLRTAAVIGKDAPLALLQAVADQTEDVLRRGLAHLQALEFLHETRLFPDVQYTFTHAFTHEVAYGSLLQDRRRAMHARLVEAIEALYPDRLSEWTDRLAHHVARGEVWTKARDYFRPVGRTGFSPIMDSSAWWMGKHNQAVELGRTELTAATPFKNFPLQVVAHFRLGQAYHALGEYSQSLHFLRRNVESLEGDLLRDRFGMPGLASVFSRTWLVLSLMERGDFTEGISRGEEAIQIAESVDDPYSVALAHFGIGYLYSRKGESQKAVAALERSQRLTQSGALHQLFPLVASPLGSAYGLSERVNDALLLLEQAVEQAASIGFAGLQSSRLQALGEAYLLAGRFANASEAAERALDLSREHQERGNQAWALWLRGEIASREEPPDPARAGAWYRQALALAEELGMRPLLARCRLGLGRLYRRAGDRARAEEHLIGAASLFRGLEMRFWLPQAEAELAMRG
jgi:class 3 adenylate cyclase/tetratricopeptide (TPR) repeat protein